MGVFFIVLLIIAVVLIIFTVLYEVSLTNKKSSDIERINTSNPAPINDNAAHPKVVPQKKPVKKAINYSGLTADQLGITVSYGYSFANKSAANQQIEKNINNPNNKTGIVNYDEIVKERELDFDGDRDAWEGWFYDNGYGNKLSLSLKIEYTDINDAKTTRNIETTKFNDSHILARCLLRKANRSFAVSQISHCVDTETGEIIDDVYDYLLVKYKETVNYSVDTLLDEHFDTLKVLYYVAKADGQFRKAEKEIVACYLGELVNDKRITVEIIKDVFDYVDVITMHGFKLALHKSLKNKLISPDKLKQCCVDIVKTQKTVTNSEAEALSYIDKKILKST